MKIKNKDIEKLLHEDDDIFVGNDNNEDINISDDFSSKKSIDVPSFEKMKSLINKGKREYNNIYRGEDKKRKKKI